MSKFEMHFVIFAFDAFATNPPIYEELYVVLKLFIMVTQFIIIQKPSKLFK